MTSAWWAMNNCNFMDGTTIIGSKRYSLLKEDFARKQSKLATKRFKGKTYEEIMGTEKAKQLKEAKSIHFKKIDRKGSKNSRALKIKIFDNKDNIILETNGNFMKLCKENNLPASALQQSYINDGRKLYENITDPGNIAILSRKDWLKYKGYYALKV